MLLFLLIRDDPLITLAALYGAMFSHLNEIAVICVVVDLSKPYEAGMKVLFRLFYRFGSAGG